MRKVQVLVLTGYGLNCDHETAYAFELAGASADRVHINALIDGAASLDDYQILVFGGGFSWGDDHGAGVVQAVRMKNNIGDKMLAFIEQKNLVIGICNGFQTLVNVGLLPGIDGDYTKRAVALVANDGGNFRDQWVTLAVQDTSPCVFTSGITCIDLPVRHGEGKFYAEEKTIQKLLQNNQVVLRYAAADGTPADGRFPDNPNGSLHDIAGICDPSGHIFGLMPHPEAYNHPANHPDWARAARQADGGGDAPLLGIRMFENAVAYIQGRLT